MLKLHSAYTFIKKEGNITSFLRGIEVFRISTIKEAHELQSKAKSMKKQGYKLAEVWETVEILCVNQISYEIIDTEIDINKLNIGKIIINISK